MTFPLDSEFAREFAEGLETILVVEEKRSFLELHLRDALYSMAARGPPFSARPMPQGAPLFPPSGELDPDKIAKVRRRTARSERTTESVAARVRFIDDVTRGRASSTASRAAEFLFRLPAQPFHCCCFDGQVAGGGIGCHTMAMRLIDSNRAFRF